MLDMESQTAKRLAYRLWRETKDRMVRIGNVTISAKADLSGVDRVLADRPEAVIGAEPAPEFFA